MTAFAGIERSQNADGGWGYNKGSSWTEPTCYAIVALIVAGLENSEACKRGMQWLASRQRRDGGWSPCDRDPESTWVTALPLLLAAPLLPRPQQDRAAAWLIAQTGRETSFVFRLRMRLLNVHLENAEFDGWPWHPAAAAWVIPTGLSLLAMKKYSRIAGADRCRDRIEQATRFLLARRCRDGGWNHGSTRALGYDSDSYPEATGIALLALHDSTAPEIAAAEKLAERQLASCSPCDAASWLTIALAARSKSVAGAAPQARKGTIESALCLMALAATMGRNIFLA